MRPRIEQALKDGVLAPLRPRCECHGCEAHDQSCTEVAIVQRQVRFQTPMQSGTRPEALCAACADAMLAMKEVRP